MELKRTLREDGIPIIACIGEVNDEGIAMLRTALDTEIEQGQRTIVVVLQEIELDSRLIGLLIGTQKQLTAPSVGGTLVLVLSETNTRMLDILNLTQRFPTIQGANTPINLSTLHFTLFGDVRERHEAAALTAALERIPQ